MKQNKFITRAFAYLLSVALIIPQGLVGYGDLPVITKAAISQAQEDYEVTPDYLYSFDTGTVSGPVISSTAGAATIIGSGSIVEDEERGRVFDNNSLGTSGLRTDYLSLPQVLSGVTDGFTVSMYIKSTRQDSSYWGSVFNAYGGEPENFPMTQLGFNMIGRANSAGFVDAVDGSENNIDSYNNMKDGNWHQVAYAVKPDKISVYLDGDVISEVDLDGSNGKSSGDLFTTASLSRLINVNVGGNCFWPDNDVNALYDDIAIYHSFLTAEELANDTVSPKFLYTFEEGTVFNNKVANVMTNGLIIGNGTTVLDAERGQVFSNGAELTSPTGRINYIDLPFVFDKVTLDSGFTLSAWVKKGAADLEYWGDIFAASNNGHSTMTKLGINMIARINAVGGEDDSHEYVDLEDGSKFNGTSYDTINDGKWHQIAYTVSNHMIATYIDGVRTASKPLDASTKGATYGSFFDDLNTLNQISFGGNSLWGDPNPDPDINGYFDDISFYSKVLTLSELQQNFVVQGGVIEEEEDVIPTKEITDSQLKDYYSPVYSARNSVHDPSIVVSSNESGNKTYSVFGSHMGVSKTEDLMNWTVVTGETADSTLFADKEGNIVSYNSAFTQNALTGNTTLYDQNGIAYTIDLGNYDINDWISDHTIQGNMWAPDVIYNTSMNKWCMYLSLNGAKWNSSIVLLTSDHEYGPYVYQAPIIFSGFSKEDSSKSYKNTDLEIALGGTLTELPYKYNKITDGKWGEFWPHAIDPAVFYDSEGDLWMTYGSWSGGIYIIQLDERTGLRDYSVKYDNEGEGTRDVISDAYFGKKIAGGHYVSGEGPYIEKIGNYYFLFLSYGFYSPEGGYNMRVFRSETPEGPYVDTKGNSAIYSSYVQNFNGTDNRGMNLMANYKWNTMTKGELAQGHNSAFVDGDGKAYVVYHTKFDDGTVGHELRVHQLYVNEDEWIVAAPYEYAGETLSSTGYAIDDIAGNYEIIVHKYKLDYANLETIKPVNVKLNSDGSITGDYEGSWSQEEGTPYATVSLNGKIYKGVFSKQIIDQTNVETMCFSVLDSDGLSVWGSKYISDSAAVSFNVQNTTVPAGVYTSFTLPTTGNFKTKYQWTSSNESVLGSDGTVITPEHDTDVILTMVVSKGDYYYTNDYSIRVYADRSMEEDAYLVGSYFENNPEELSTRMDGSLYVKNPFYTGTNAGINISNGVSIEFDVESTGDLHMLGTIFSFLGDSGRMYFTPGSYLGYNAAGNYFDANVRDFKLVEDYLGDLAHVEIKITPKGFSVIVNGTEVYNQDIIDTENGGGKITNYADVLTWLNASADKLYFGYGSWWNGVGFDEANSKISNVKCYVQPTGSSTSGYVYEMDYEKVTDAITRWKTTGLVSIENDDSHGNYIQFTSKEALGAVSLLPAYAKVDVAYIVDSNISLQAGEDVGTEFVILGTDKVYKDNFLDNGVDSGYILKLTKVDSSVEENIWSINDGVTVKLPDTWISVKVAVNPEKSIAVVNISDDNKVYFDGLVAIDGVGVIDGFYFRSMGSNDVLSIDDIKLAYPDSHFKVEEAKLTTDSITYYNNPFYGKNLEQIHISYTINWDEDAAKNGWDGLFAFYNSTNAGRVSFQSLPYLCYNGAGKWLDINNPSLAGIENVAVSLEKGKDYTFHYTITKDKIEIRLDNQVLNLVTNGEASLADVLNYISTCDKITVGVGKGVSAYWHTEKCSLKNLEISVHDCKTYSDQIIKEASCQTDGIKVLEANSCGEAITEIIPAIGYHTFGNWVLVKNATNSEDGLRERTCSVCGEIESEVIPKLPTSTEDTEDGNDDLTVDKPSKPVTETIKVNTENPSIKADVIITKDAKGKTTDTYASISVISADVKNNKAEVTIDKDVIQKILNAAPSTDRIEIVINESVIDIAKKVDKKDELPIKIILPKDLKIDNKEIIISGKTLDLAKTEDKKLTVQVSDGVNPLYTIVVPQSVLADQKKKCDDVNITLKTIKKTKNYTTVSIGDNAKLPFPISVRISTKTLQSVKPKSKVYLYRVNGETGKLEEVPNNVRTITSAGNITMSTLVGGEFFLSNSQKLDAVLLTDKVSLYTTKTAISKGKSLNLKAVLPDNLALVSKFKFGDPYGKEEGKVTYSVSDKSIASISSKGKLTAKKAGKVKVKVTILLENKQKRVIERWITVK